MAKSTSTILGHYVVAELSELTGSYYVDIDGVRKASGSQWWADQQVITDLDGHQLLFRFSGKARAHIEIVLDGKIIHSF